MNFLQWANFSGNKLQPGPELETVVLQCDIDQCPEMSVPALEPARRGPAGLHPAHYQDEAAQLEEGGAPGVASLQQTNCWEFNLFI